MIKYTSIISGLLFIALINEAFCQEHEVGLDVMRAELNWSERVSFHLVSDIEVDEGRHERYQQYLEGIPVLGGQVVVHRLLNNPLSKSSKLWPEPSRSWKSGISPEEVRDIIDLLYPGYDFSEYYDVKPVWADRIYPEYSGLLVPAWNVVTHSHYPHGRFRILIDAETGIPLMRHSMLCGFKGCTEGEQITLYHGIQEIPMVWDSDTNLYYLSTNDSLSEVRTYMADGGEWYEDDGLIDPRDSIFLNGALDAHWAVREVRDFFFTRFGRDGMRDKSETIKSYIFPLSFPYNNAFWDGEAMYYGAGDSKDYGPFTSIDICAHEYVHGITEFTSALEYTYESGALNEAMSDIFGKILEYKRSPENFSWILGQRIGLDQSVSGIRDMSDPNNLGDPKYYKGEYWWTDRFDNGGVHVNSGILNYWFYLLVEGGSGIAERGETYSVEALGWDDAIDLVYLLLTQYLTPTSQYADARNESLKIARSIFGTERHKIESVSQAWYAVGLGHPLRERDISLTAHDFNTTFCDTVDLAPVVDLTNQGFFESVPAGTEIILGYTYRNQSKVIDTVLLEEDLSPGAIYQHSFSQPIVETDVVRSEIEIIMESDWDLFDSNNVSVVEVERVAGLDFEVELFQSQDSRPQCERGDSLRVFFAGQYNGCSPISAKDSFLMTIDLHGDVKRRWINPSRTVYPGAFVFFGEFDFVDMPLGFHRAVISFSHLNDPIPKNDTIDINFYRLLTTQRMVEVDFRQSSNWDSTIVVFEPGNYHLYQIQEVEGQNGLVIGSKGIFNSNGDLDIDTFSKRLGTFMGVNQDHVTNIRMCVSTKGFLEPRLEFEAMRQAGQWRQRAFGARAANSSALAVGFTGFIEYLIDMEYDEFVSYSYPLPQEDTSVAIRIQNLVLWSRIDSVSGEITDDLDRIVIRNVRITDASVQTQQVEVPNMTVFPNPSSGSFELKLPTELGRGTLRIFNIEGRQTQQIPLNNDSSVQLKLHQPGVHYLLYESLTGVRLGKKILIKRAYE